MKKYLIIDERPKSVGLDNVCFEYHDDISDYMDIHSKVNSNGHMYIIIDVESKLIYTSKTRQWDDFETW